MPTIRDLFATRATKMDDPYTFSHEVNPSDTEDLPAVTRALYIGANCNLRLMLVGDPKMIALSPDLGGATVSTFKFLTPGTLLRVRCRRVLLTGSDFGPQPGPIVALW